jgi:hypothetical protein
MSCSFRFSLVIPIPPRSAEPSACTAVLLQVENMENPVAQFQPVHHAFGCDVGNLPGHLPLLFFVVAI